MTNHLKDTKTKRYYFDEAYPRRHAPLVRLQAHPRRLGRSPASRRRSEPTTYTRLQLRYPAPVQRQDRRTTRSRSTSRTRAAARRATFASAIRWSRSRSGRSPPTRRRAARSGSSSRPATRSRWKPARSRRRPPMTPGGPSSRPAGCAEPLDVLRLPRRRPTGRLHRRMPSRPTVLDEPAEVARPLVARRRDLGQARRPTS